MKQPGSNFVSLIGLGLLAVLIMVAAYFDMESLEGFLVLCLLLCLICYLWSKSALSRIELDAPEEDICAFPDECIEMDMAIHNRKMLPLVWLDLCFPTGEKSCVAAHPEDEQPTDEQEKPEHRDELCASFLWVMPHQSIRWTQRAMAVHRGVCRVNSIGLVSGDGFGLASKTKNSALSAPFRFVVYPAMLNVNVSPILNRLSEMEAARNGFYSDRTLLSTTRDYHEGDPIKNINWRLMAKRDDLQVNVHEKLAMRRVCFVPDMYSFTYIAEVEEGTQRVKRRVVDHGGLEHMLSFAASLIVRLHEREVLCSLVLPAFGEQAARVVVPESAEEQVMQLLTALAEINYEAQPTVLPLEQMENERHKLGQMFVLSSSWQASMLRADPIAEEKLSAVSILNRDDEQESFSRDIFKESDFLEL